MNLNTAFPNWLTTGGIFTALSGVSGYSPPWSTVSASTLDIQYHGNHSGDKLISPLVLKLLDANNVLSFTNAAKLAAVLIGLYDKNWSHLWTTLTQTYDATKNNNMTETDTVTETDTGTVTDAGTTTHGETVHTVTNETNADTTTHGQTVHSVTNETNIDTTTHGQTISTSNSVTASQDVSKFGFNTSTAVPTDHDAGTNTGTGSETHGGTTKLDTDHDNDVTETHGGTTKVDTDHDNDVTETHGGTTGKGNTRTNDLTHSVSDTKTRSGLSGITPQEMLQKERNLWQWKFFETVFEDIDKVLTCPIYESEDI